MNTLSNVRFRTLLLALFVAALIGPAALVWAADPEKEKKSQDTELAKHMEVIEKGMKKLKKSLKDSKENEASAATAADMKKAATACLKEVPVMAKKVPEGERAKFVENYKKEMNALIAEIGKLEDAVKAGKNDEALAIHKKLGDMEDKGHEKFTSDE
jgi:soluble cytochrome b562